MALAELIELTKQNIDKTAMYLTTDDVAEKTGLSRQGLCKHINEGVLNAYRYKNRILIHPSDFDEYMQLIKCGIIISRPRNKDKSA